MRSKLQAIVSNALSTSLPNNQGLLRKSVAEFIGTFAIVFIGCGAIMVAERFPNSIHPNAVPVVFGLVVAAMVYALGHISGAHFNPAVTLAFAIGRHFPPGGVLAYWAAQFSGGIAAIGLLSIMLPHGAQFGATSLHVPILQGFAWEVLLTFLLMFVIIAVATDSRAVGTMAGAAIGATVMIGSFVGGPVTGASMNPARSLGPAIFEWRLDTIWLYLIAPMIGAAIAAISYEWIRRE